MRFSVVSLLACGLSVNAHAIMQKISINGAEQSLLDYLRAPSSNNPVQDVSSSNMVCGAPGSVSKDVATIAAGTKLGVYWQHLIGGPQGSNDADNPIAKSHKGPIMIYLASTSGSPASASQTGLQWFKISEDNFDTSTKQWGVDHMIANNGWSYFTLPSCIAPGNYLLRTELLALHSASSQGGAQFYQSCAQITVTGSGSFKPSSSQTIQFPGGYSATDPRFHLTSTIAVKRQISSNPRRGTYPVEGTTFPSAPISTMNQHMVSLSLLICLDKSCLLSNTYVESQRQNINFDGDFCHKIHEQ